ncbi:hypothetical protein EAE96_004004 [Botrytis aclada]|nr:hypothetical protein EAE96_004004 [Botrytis aclada]
MNPNSRGYYQPGYGPPNPNPYAYQNAPVYDYSSGQYYYPQPRPWVTPSPNGGWQSQGYQQYHGTPYPNGAWQPQSYQQPWATPNHNGGLLPQDYQPPPLNRDQQRAAARKVLLQCGNCSRIGHELKRCVGPVNAFGVIDGCPMCNTTKAMISWPSELTELPAWISIPAESRPKIWTPSFALQYQLENPHYWKDYVYAEKWREDPPIAEDPAWGNPFVVIHLKDRSERGLTRNASGFGRRPQSQLPPPSAEYFPPMMMPQLPSFPPLPPPQQPASSPDTFALALAGLEGRLDKFAQNLKNLAPAGGNNGHGRKKFAIKGASKAKVKDRSQSPKAQPKTESYRERSPLRTPCIKLEDRESYPELKSPRVKADPDGDFPDNDVEPLLKVEDELSNFDDAPEDAASAAEVSKKTIRNRKNRARAKARRHAAIARRDADTANADAATAAEQANVSQDTEVKAVKKVSLSARSM